MTQEEKSLLLQDLCARLPYVLYVTVRDSEEKDDFQPFEVLGIKEDLVWVKNTMIGVDHFDTIEVVKPYLRPMSSITEEESNEFESITFPLMKKDWDGNENPACIRCIDIPKYMNFILSHHFDYRGLIEKGLALEAPEGMYNIKD